MFVLHVIFFSTTFLSLLGFLSGWGWHFELISHFKVQFFLIQLWCILVYAVFKKWKWAGVALFFVAINAVEVVPFYWPQPGTSVQTSHGQPKLKILQYNLQELSTSSDPVINYIRSINPDILLLEELNQRWHDSLSSLLETFPYKIMEVRNGVFGIGLFSRVPVKNLRIHRLGGWNPMILGEVNLDNQKIAILASHTNNPGSQKGYVLRNAELKEMISVRKNLKDNVVFLGDINSTSFSRHFKSFVKGMGLRDARLGFGVHPTWPMTLPLAAITIDHCLVSDKVIVLKHQTGPNIGSDHFPVYVELGIK